MYHKVVYIKRHVNKEKNLNSQCQCQSLGMPYNHNVI